MQPLNAQAFEEVRQIADQAALDTAAGWAQAAELRQYRRLHAFLRRRRDGLPMLVAREIANMPAPGDLEAWKKIVWRGTQEREAAEQGMPDLLAVTR